MQQAIIIAYKNQEDQKIPFAKKYKYSLISSMFALLIIVINVILHFLLSQ